PVIRRPKQSAKQASFDLVNCLVSPEGFEQLMVIFGICPIEAGDPFPESFRYLFLRAVTQDSLGVVSRPVFRSLQVIQQLLLRRPDKLRFLNQGSPLGCKSPDATMLMVPHWTAKIDLAMLD
ncbi:MAG TPA: hypothetical protein DD471_16105, partial [Planctomycetes bacterium]|nr:hypothetical protein [Planctomycetota bacterium]